MENQFNKEVIECCICTMPIQEEKATGWKYGNNAEPLWYTRKQQVL